MSRHRGRFALALALAAGLALIVTGGPGPTRPDGAPHLATEWPDARILTLPGALDDGSVVQPLLVLDPRTWLGTAHGPDGRKVRLLLFRDGRPTEWRGLANTESPQFGGATAGDGVLAWVESTLPPDGAVVNRIWAAEPDGTPREVTSDVGDVTLVNSGHDLVIADGRLHWTAAGATGDTTELRSVPLTGGDVTVREFPGRWSLSEWPWLTSAAGPTAEVLLHRVDTDEQIAVPVGDREFVTCSPQWCRVLTPHAREERIALTRPDGSEHQRLGAPATAMSALVDVAVAGRFEAWTTAGSGSGRDRRLMLYDIDRGESFAVATGVGGVMARGDYLWWSTGPEGPPTWHALDLTSLDP